MGKDMADAFDRLGALPADAFVGEGGEDANAELEAVGSILERHKVLQERLWPSINSPAVAALYAAVAPHATGSHICGAGNGGHIVVFMKPGVDVQAVADAVAGCAEAPDARLVRMRMMLGDGGDGGGAGVRGDGASGGGGVGDGPEGGGKRRRIA
jgi:fucokinase